MCKCNDVTWKQSMGSFHCKEGTSLSMVNKRHFLEFNKMHNFNLI